MLEGLLINTEEKVVFFSSFHLIGVSFSFAHNLIFQILNSFDGHNRF